MIPRVSKPGIAGTRGDALLVRLKSPPVEGKANSELIEVIAAALRIPKSNVAIISGEHSKLKRVRVDGITAEAVNARFTTHDANAHTEGDE